MNYQHNDLTKKIIGYFFDKACVVKLKEGQQPDEKKSGKAGWSI